MYIEYENTWKTTGHNDHARLIICINENNILVNASSHILNVFGLVLQATVIMVGLYTGFNLTSNGCSKLGTQRAFLKLTKMTENTLGDYMN